MNVAIPVSPMGHGRWNFMIKIIASVDAFSRKQFLETAASALGRWAAVFPDARIEPVYVLSPESAHLSNDEFTAEYAFSMKQAARGALLNFRPPDDSVRFEEPKVLLQPDLSSSITEVLASYARGERADMIAVTTAHERSSVNRLFLEDFVSALTALSPVPVLCFGPAFRHESRSRPPRILFATDFTPAARRAFQRVIALASETGGRIILFHQDTLPLSGEETRLLHGRWTHPRPEERESNGSFSLARDWAADAAGRNVPVLFERVPRDEDYRGVAPSILSASKRHGTDLIAMAVSTSPVASFLESGISPAVLAAAECPVWLLKPPQEPRARAGTELVPPKETSL